MRICLLRAGLSRADGLSDLVLGNPRAWLGTAYHEVLEKVPEIDRQGDVDRDLDRLWTDAIARQYERVKSHTLDRRFGSPETWPGYHLTEGSVLRRAVEIALNPEDCEREAAEAVALLDKYNKRIENAADPRTLALASPEACRWCQYKSFCPAFWEKADSTWSGRLDGAAVEGILLEP